MKTTLALIDLNKKSEDLNLILDFGDLNPLVVSAIKIKMEYIMLKYIISCIELLPAFCYFDSFSAYVANAQYVVGPLFSI